MRIDSPPHCEYYFPRGCGCGVAYCCYYSIAFGVPPSIRCPSVQRPPVQSWTSGHRDCCGCCCYCATHSSPAVQWPRSRPPSDPRAWTCAVARRWPPRRVASWCCDWTRARMHWSGWMWPVNYATASDEPSASY